MFKLLLIYLRPFIPYYIINSLQLSKGLYHEPSEANE